jgi:hypothetical protein
MSLNLILAWAVPALVACVTTEYWALRRAYRKGQEDAIRKMESQNLNKTVAELTTQIAAIQRRRRWYRLPLLTAPDHLMFARNRKATQPLTCGLPFRGGPFYFLSVNAPIRCLGTD